MDYNESVEYYNSLNVRGMKFGLDRIRLLLSYLDDPDRVLKIIHVAGTNGKGSTIAFTSSILTKAGYRVGAYTSPHLLRINETIRIGDENIRDNEFADIISKIKSTIDSNISLVEVELTSFEILTVAAFMYFKEMKCDIVLLETGLGGRLDATNVINSPLISVITKIAYDHVGILGHDIESITKEKAGIIKKDSTVILSLQEYNEVLDIIKERCVTMNSKLIQVDENEIGQVFNYKTLKNVKINLLGTHQINNATTAIEIIFALTKYGYIISDKNILDGLKNVYWPCRLELLKTKPDILIDAAHNVDGVKALVEFLGAKYENKKITFIFGVLKDKNYIGMIEKAIPLAKNIVTVTPNSDRALEAYKLADIIRGYGITVDVSKNIDDAIKLSLEGTNSVICIFGSLSFVGEAREILVRKGTCLVT